MKRQSDCHYLVCLFIPTNHNERDHLFLCSPLCDTVKFTGSLTKSSFCWRQRVDLRCVSCRSAPCSTVSSDLLLLILASVPHLAASCCESCPAESYPEHSHTGSVVCCGNKPAHVHHNTFTMCAVTTISLCLSSLQRSVQLVSSLRSSSNRVNVSYLKLLLTC